MLTISSDRETWLIDVAATPRVIGSGCFLPGPMEGITWASLAAPVLLRAPVRTRTHRTVDVTSTCVVPRRVTVADRNSRHQQFVAQ
ncbi:hypothetical protein CJ178_12525 [Rhodococcus sp. ACPA4]|nr:hypothetical protein CJ178_12525 [Rhodococcus sp. ACPA4]